VKRFDAALGGAVVLFVVYAATLAPDVTFWDAGEFIAAAHALGIPHPPGTPLFILLLKAWTALVPLPFALATNLLSAVVTAIAAAVTARFVLRASNDSVMAFAVALLAGGMSTAWLNATETEVYAASLLLGVLMIWAGERAGRADGERWTYLTAYFMALAVPLHLSALVAAPAAIALASLTPRGLSMSRALMLGGTLVIAAGVGRMSVWTIAVGATAVLLGMRDWSFISIRPLSRVSTSDASRVDDASFVTDADSSLVTRTDAFRITPAASVLGLIALGVSALAFLYVRARFDPAINQGDSDTWRGLVEMVARRQYDVAPLWPRMAPLWLQVANFGQYADWQAALSLGPTVMPAVPRSAFTILFFALGYAGAVAHFHLDRRTWVGVATLFVGGSVGVIVYLNLHAGPSLGHGILPDNAVHEARERDYFFVFAFWAWAVWAAIGAVWSVRRLRLPAWSGVVVAALPIALNWRAVTRRAEPERALPMTFAEMLLESTPPNGVLFVAGDNDSYPLWYAQQVRAVRPDVAIITIPLLPTDWYRSQIAKRHALLDSAGASRYDGTLAVAARIAEGARRARRPVAAAVTLTPAERARLGGPWGPSGMVYVEGNARVDTTTMHRVRARVTERLGTRAPRDAIDPVSRYFREMLECPRMWIDGARADSTRLDSVCSYR
jgi:hypothetical protein